MRRHLISGAAAVLAITIAPLGAAWGGEQPAIAVLGRELDRTKGAGDPHDKERDAGHFVSLDDAGLVAGVLALDALPTTREAYDSALRDDGKTTQYNVGYLPLAIVDGWQQLVKNFAYWRAASVGGRTALDPADRAWFDAGRQRRERLVIRDLGVWSHYVADASQPMHVSIHFDGWGSTIRAASPPNAGCTPILKAPSCAPTSGANR